MYQFVTGDIHTYIYNMQPNQQVTTSRMFGILQDYSRFLYQQALEVWHHRPRQEKQELFVYL